MTKEAYIRAFKPQQDVEAFVALNERTFHESIPLDRRPSLKAFRAHHQWLLSRYLPFDKDRARITVATSDGKDYLGHCWLGVQQDFFTNDPIAWIFDISVIEPARGCGIGTLLLDDVRAHAKRMGFPSIGLQVMAHNQSAQSFYRKHAFALSSHAMQLRLE